MVLEGVRPPDVPNHRLRVPVPALVHDACEIRAALGRCRDVAGPQRVRSEGRGIQAGRRRMPLEHVRDGLRREACRPGSHPPRARHRPEQRALNDPGRI